MSYKLGLFAMILALIVITLGAYTRLKDAGLGCPDWPGCYGTVTVPKTPDELAKAAAQYPEMPFEEAKAWPEMIHRHVAGTLGILIVVLAGFAIREKKPIVGIALVALVIFQALLGMWTVTLKLLPVVVMGHLLGGMTILALLTWLTLRFKGSLAIPPKMKAWRFWAALGLFIVAIQIALGGWVSSNYAALICTDFPTCQGQLIPPLDMKQAFDFLAPIGPNYQGGLLDTTARVTIQVLHRLGAVITFVYLLLLSIGVMIASKLPFLRRLAGAILLVLVLQVGLGILNVLWLLPIKLAVAHNGVAAILLALVIALNYAVFAGTKR